MRVLAGTKAHVTPYEFTFHKGRLRIFRVTWTVFPKLLCPNANTTVSSAPRPRAIPLFRNSMASFANLNRAWSDPMGKKEANTGQGEYCRRKKDRQN